jgi:hypothetical protein
VANSTSTQTEKVAQEKLIQEAFPNLAKALSIKGDSIVGFTPEQFAELKNQEQNRLDKLTEAFGIAIKDSLGRTPAAASKVEVNDAPTKSVNRESLDSMAAWIKTKPEGPKTFKLDKNEYLRTQGYAVSEEGAILGRSVGVKASEAITTATMPINYDRDAIFIPGGQLAVPARQFFRVKATGQGNGTVAWYSGTNAAFGAITEGSAPSEDSITIAQVTGSPTTRGSYVKLKYSWLEDNPFSIPEFMAMASMKAAIDAENTEVFTTLVAAATPATGHWINGSTAATITAAAGTSGNDDIASMTLSLTGVSGAKNKLDVKGYGNQGPYVFAIHPKNYNELIISSGITTLTQQGQPSIALSGVASNLLGVQLGVYDQVAAQDNTTSDTYQNVMFVNQQAFGLGVGREVTVKAEEHSELQQVYWTATHRIVSKVLDNAAYVRVSCAQ